jgi:hypothetical protein
VLDRESTFADPEIVNLLKTRFVPAAIDQFYQRQQKDAEGDFYRKIATQGPQDLEHGTTQGLYIATASGKLVAFNNNRGPERIRGLLEQALKDHPPAPTTPLATGARDSRFARTPPAGGLVVRVTAKVLGGYEPAKDEWQQIFQSALARDNLWIRQDEHEALVRGQLLDSLQRRLARFHLIDNTRGEPPMWEDAEVRQLQLQLTGGKLSGTVKLATAAGDRGYEAELLGFVESEGGRVVRFDVVAKGLFWGEGTYTRGAPPGKFPLAIAFTLSSAHDESDRVPPQGTKGWLPSYLR